MDNGRVRAVIFMNYQATEPIAHVSIVNSGSIEVDTIKGPDMLIKNQYSSSADNSCFRVPGSQQLLPASFGSRRG